MSREKSREEGVIISSETINKTVTHRPATNSPHNRGNRVNMFRVGWTRIDPTRTGVPSTEDEVQDRQTQCPVQPGRVYSAK